MTNNLKKKMVVSAEEMAKYKSKNLLIGLLYDSVYEYKKGEDAFEKDWKSRKKRIMRNYKVQMNRICDNTEEINMYLHHNHQREESDDDTLSSADERDIELLMSGDHSHFFTAYSLIQKFKN